MERKQLFSMTFDKVLESGYVFHSMFMEDKAAFTAFSSRFADPFADEFLANLKAADALPIYDDDLNYQTSLTMKLNEKLRESAVFYSRLLLYVKLAWGRNCTQLEAFARAEFNAKRNQALIMNNLLKNAYLTASSPDFKPDLLAAGFTDANISHLDTLATELNEALLQRDAFVNAKNRRRWERIDAFNKFWEQMVFISKSARLIFTDSPAHVKTYLLYPKSNRSQKTKVEE